MLWLIMIGCNILDLHSYWSFVLLYVELCEDALMPEVMEGGAAVAGWCKCLYLLSCTNGWRYYERPQ